MSKYFALSEMKCRDGTHVPNELLGNADRVLSQADVIREDRGGPVQIVSGFRTDAHNAGRGVKDSYHLKAMALDLRPHIRHDGKIVRWKSIDLAERIVIIEDFHGAINRLKAGRKLPEVWGIGIYTSDDTGWVHIDVRPRPISGHIARWTGKTMGSEQIA